MENAMVLYEKQNAVQLKKYKDLVATMDMMKAKEKELKEFLKDEMDRCGIASFKSKDGSITITNVAPTAYTTLDTSRLKTEDFDTWEDLVEKYPKFVEKSGYVKVKVK